MAFIEGTDIRAHHKAAGAEKRGSTARNEMGYMRITRTLGKEAVKKD